MAPTDTKRPVVVSGPSGAGKSTLLKRLFAAHPGVFDLSISHTTRGPRSGETDGVEYHFTTREKFQELVAADGFIENAQFGGNFYGTSFQAVKDITAKGRVCVLDIEMEGVKQMKKSSLNARYVFLAPPSLEVLETRLRGRATDSEDAIQKRLAQARNEVEYSKVEGVHDKIIVNDDLEKAFKELDEWVMAEV